MHLTASSSHGLSAEPCPRQQVGWLRAAESLRQQRNVTQLAAVPSARLLVLRRLQFRTKLADRHSSERWRSKRLKPRVVSCEPVMFWRGGEPFPQPPDELLPWHAQVRRPAKHCRLCSTIGRLGGNWRDLQPIQRSPTVVLRIQLLS